MKKHARRALGVLLLMPLVVGAAVAEDPEGSFWFWIRPGWTYADLGVVNSAIADGNSLFRSEGLTTVDDFHNTFSLRIDAHLNLNGLGIGALERFTAYAGYSTLFGSQSKSFNRVIKTSIQGKAVSGGLLYRVPWLAAWEESLDDLDLYAGVGALYSPGFELTASDEELGTNREFLEERIFKGDALGAELRLNLDYFLSHKITLLAGVSYQFLEFGDMDHEVHVSNPNAFNPEGDDDGDGIENQSDPDYNGGLDEAGQRAGGNVQRMYGRMERDDETQEWSWVSPADRFLSPLYEYDPSSYPGAPFEVYDPSATFDLDMGGVQVQVGLTYYLF